MDSRQQNVLVGAGVVLLLAVVLTMLEDATDSDVFGFFAFLLFVAFIVMLIAGLGGGGSRQQQQQQVVVIAPNRSRTSGVSSTAAPSQAVRCPGCKGLNAYQARFCGQCGTSLGSPP